MQSNIKQGSILAGVLHDLGKVFYRAKLPEFLECSNHTQVGEAVIRNIYEAAGRPIDDAVFQAQSLHHAYHLKERNTADILPSSWIVYEADNIAAGVDRRELESQEKSIHVSLEEQSLDEEPGVVSEKAPGKRHFYKYTPLRTIFNCINTENPMDKMGYPLRTQSDQENDMLFQHPREVWRANGTHNLKASQDQYQKVASALYKELKETAATWLDHPNSLLQILEAYLSYVPSDTHEKRHADISLFDHLKLTGALAGCLAAWLEEKHPDALNAEGILPFTHWDDKDTHRREYKPYLLVSLDLSGIQKFLYTLSSKRALKQLKARSLYLDFMLEHLVDEVLDGCGLFRTNLLYTGGGHAYLLLPNTQQTEAVLNRLEKTCNWFFWEQTRNRLYLAVASLPLSANDLMNLEKTDPFGKLSRQTSEKKQRRYHSDPELLRDILEPGKPVEKEKECQICRADHQPIKTVENEPSLEWCSFCKQLDSLANQISQIRNIKAKLYLHIRPQSTMISNAMPLPNLSNSEEAKFLQVGQDQPQTAPIAGERIYSLNTWTVGPHVHANLWVASIQLDSDGLTPGTFEELCEGQTGIQRLGVLRADVDNLGAVFKNGISPQFRTLSRITAFSRQLTMFFKHYVVQVARKRLKDPTDPDPLDAIEIWPGDQSVENWPEGEKQPDLSRRRINIIYAGGDDLFVVGPWHELILFTLDLRRAFERFTAGKLSFSAGIGLFPIKYPLYRMADLTGELEAQAKKVEIAGKKKNALCLLSRPENEISTVEDQRGFAFQWTAIFNETQGPLYELKELLEFERKLNRVDLVLPTSALYKILDLFRSLNQKEPLQLARLHYAVARFLEDKEKRCPAIQAFRENLIRLAVDNDPESITAFLCGLEWFLLLQRTTDARKENIKIPVLAASDY